MDWINVKYSLPKLRDHILDCNIPIFHKQPEYIEDLVYHRGGENE